MKVKYYYFYDKSIKKVVPHFKRGNYLISLVTGNKTLIKQDIEVD